MTEISVEGEFSPAKGIFFYNWGDQLRTTFSGQTEVKRVSEHFISYRWCYFSQSL